MNALPSSENLLISCVGTYQDSGSGTGALLCVKKNKEVIVIDRIDSTGLCNYEGTFYRYIRSLKLLAGYNESGIKSTLSLPEISDAHDILVRDGEIISVSTGSNEVLVHDFTGKLIRRVQFDGADDAWHLNCLWPHDDKLYLAAFGKFPGHRDWNSKGCTGTGIVFDIETQEEIIRDLSGPHHPRFIDGVWMVCNSHKKSLRVIEAGGAHRDIQLGGFTRGICFNDRHIYVGINADRKSATQSAGSRVAVLDRKSLEVVSEIEVPFPEVYDILFVPDSFIAGLERNAQAFGLFAASGTRAAQLETQVNACADEVASLKKEIKRLQAIVPARPGIWQRVRNKLTRLLNGNSPGIKK